MIFGNHLGDARWTAKVDAGGLPRDMAQPWSSEEIIRLKELGLDPIQNSRLKLAVLVQHFKGAQPSVFAVTESGSGLHVSKGLARKVKKLRGCLRSPFRWL
jgi:hypothetical protein